MNEADTRAERIEPQLKAAGWGAVEHSKILREHKITDGKIQPAAPRTKPLIADYILTYKNQKLAVVEAKSDELEVAEGVAQAKNYATKLQLPAAFAANGNAIYQIDMKTGKEGLVPNFPTPDELWHKAFAAQNAWRDRFDAVPFPNKSGSWHLRYYQEIAVNRVTHAIANNRDRILLTLATGTGKTSIAFHIAWKLVQTRWNLKRDGARLPRILFLADRNILATQAYNDFTSFNTFEEAALARITPERIAQHGGVPTNATLFFTIFQTFMTTAYSPGLARDPSQPDEPQFNFRGYPPDFFDLIIIDECHRGGANDESNWRAILEYFAPAVQLGLTATPKRRDNVDTYKYFGEPVYVYSLKEGINDGFLTPFKVKRIQTTLDTYVYTSDDQVIEGEVEQGRRYEESDFNRIIEIKAREAKRVDLALAEMDPKEKSLVFCATQPHAAAVRDLINQKKTNPDPLYCARVTADDGALGEQYLRDFQDNEKSIPTILTTSQKLSTGVDARNVRNIVLMRPINSMIEFKQIIGRGTRLFEGKTFFTILDFVDAYQHFSDPEWDGEPIEPEPKIPRPPRDPKDPGEPIPDPNPPPERPKKIKIKLRDGKEREIQHMIATSFWSPDGRPISAEEFMNNLYGEIPKFFASEAELRKIWSDPATRRSLLNRLADAGFGLSELATLQQLINAEKSDIFDVLEYVAYARPTVTREARASAARPTIYAALNTNQREFVDFVLDRYIQDGVSELDQEKLPTLLTQKYHALADAQVKLGPVPTIRSTFIDFQKHLYVPTAA